MPKIVKKEEQKSAEYGAENIQVLEGLEPVRKRPGMYIGSTGADGLHHLVKEIFDNGRDEAMGGFCDEIEIALLPDEIVRVADNGRGIPVETHKKTKVSALETVMTTLHAGGKFDEKSYKVAGGLHGVGASVVNALSEWLVAEVHRDGGHYMQEYARGKRKAAIKKVGASKLHGTVVTFKADAQIFSETKYDWNKLITHMRQQAYLVKKLKIRLVDAREYSGKINTEKVFFVKELELELPSYTFYFEGGLLSLVKFYNLGRKVLHDKIFYVEKEAEGVTVEAALQYIDDISSHEMTFANNTATPEGGMHLTGFRTALTRALNDYARKNEYIKEKDENFTGEDVREGMVAVVSVKLRDPQFEGQTKAKLGSVEARSATDTVFGEAFGAYLEENPDEARAIINKSILALKARKAAKAAKDSVLRKGALEGMTLPGKLADCQTRDAALAELFIVEGDSAGGSSKQGRDRETQAILPLRGKILNVEKARLDKMLDSKEVKSLIIALGTAIGDAFDLTKLRYHKVIIATDADVDGAHIRTLLLTLFFRHFRPVIDGGYIYVAQPPLYRLTKAKEKVYVYSDAEKDKEVKKMGEGVSLQRYKGLGEMNPEELWETTMNPANRVLKQVTIDDAEEADRTFDMLMGAEVPPRKLFIQTHALKANIDA